MKPQELRELGNQYLDRGRLQDAERCYREAVAADSQYAQGYSNLGYALRLQGRIAEAEASLLQAISIDPRLAHAHFHLADMAKERGDLDRSVLHYRQGLAVMPRDPAAVLGLSAVFLLKGDKEQAAALLQEALADHPNSLQLHCELGNIYRNSGKYDQARREFECCLSIDSGFWPASFNLALTQWAQGERDTAISRLRPLATDPKRIECQLALGEMLRLLGNLREGFELFEQRFGSLEPQMSRQRQILATLGDQRRWRGEPINGARLLVWSEEGLGDALMMLRYLPEIRKLGPKTLTVSCPPDFVKIIKYHGVADSVETELSPTLPFDVHCGMMSLPHLLGTTLDTIPATVPYLVVPDELKEEWGRRIAPLPGLKVGLAWAGNPKLPTDALRSIPLRALAPLMDVEGVSFLSLQKGAGAEQLAETQFPIINWMMDCADPIDTAALISNLDLVISVDTAVAHLTGALGKKVWLLNRYDTEWRWLLDRADSPWYPTMKIFRQHTPMDWSRVVMDARAELLRLARP